MASRSGKKHHPGYICILSSPNSPKLAQFLCVGKTAMPIKQSLQQFQKQTKQKCQCIFAIKTNLIEVIQQITDLFLQEKRRLRLQQISRNRKISGLADWYQCSDKEAKKAITQAYAIANKIYGYTHQGFSWKQIPPPNLILDPQEMITDKFMNLAWKKINCPVDKLETKYQNLKKRVVAAELEARNLRSQQKEDQDTQRFDQVSRKLIKAREYIKRLETNIADYENIYRRFRKERKSCQRSIKLHQRTRMEIISQDEIDLEDTYSVKKAIHRDNK